jgi:predicted dehydrogenase
MVCDLDEERARSYGERYGCAWTTDVEELAASDVEAVSVATPDHTHFAPVSRLLEAGKHVLVEKPLTTSVDEAARLEAIAAATGRIAMVDFQMRWDPSYMQAKEMVESGELGDVVMGYIRLSDAIQVAEEWLPWAGRSGPQWFLFPHTVDIMRWLIGSDPVRVHAVGRKGVLSSRGIDCLDCVQAMVEFPGAVVTFETSWIVPNAQPSVIDCYTSLYGTRGKIEYDADFAGFESVTGRYSYPWSPVGRRDRYGRLSHRIYEPMRHFVDAVMAGEETTCPFSDGVVNTAVIATVERSIDSGRPESVADVLAAARDRARAQDP